MFLRISRGVWFISVLGILASLLLVYASLPEQVVLMQEGPSQFMITREAFFYGGLFIITLINTFVFIVSAVFKANEGFRGWFNVLVATINIFLIVSLFLINAINSLEKFNFSRIGFLIYGSVILVAVWSLSWPVYAVGKKIFSSRTA